MTATMTPAARAHTHVGGVIHVAYRHRSTRMFGHTTPQPGKQHALSLDPRTLGWVAACGEVVPAECDDELGERVRTPVCKAAGGGEGVTCARCRRVMGVQRHAVQFRYAHLGVMSRWLTVKDAKFATKGEAVARMGELQAAHPATTFRVRVV